MMHPDSLARDPDIFGNEFVDHFGGTRLHELNLWNAAVTNWEGWWLSFGYSPSVINWLFSRTLFGARVTNWFECIEKFGRRDNGKYIINADPTCEDNHEDFGSFSIQCKKWGTS